MNGVSGLQHKFTAPDDSDEVSVNWALAVSLGPTDRGDWWFNLFEDDPGGCCDDPYDMQGMAWDECHNVVSCPVLCLVLL